MNKTLSILILGIVPIVAMAGGSHGAGQPGGHSHGHGNEAGYTETQAHAGAHAHQQADAGRPGDSQQVSRSIAVDMDDNMRFTPSNLDFKTGETIRFQIRNAGNIRHEMVIGSINELQEHAQMMRKNPGMQHSEANMISLAPGESGELIWQFSRAGQFDFACLVPGHLEAGMTGKIAVN